jgi:hypothetical protein
LQRQYVGSLGSTGNSKSIVGSGSGSSGLTLALQMRVYMLQKIKETICLY